MSKRRSNDLLGGPRAHVPDYEILLSDMQPTDSEAGLSVVFVDPQRSGIKQISEILATRSDLDAIHLITHGAGASIQLGSDILDLTGLRSDPVDDRADTWYNSRTPAVISGSLIVAVCQPDPDGAGTAPTSSTPVSANPAMFPPSSVNSGSASVGKASP